MQLYEVVAVEPLPPWAGMVVYYGHTRGVISDNEVVEEGGSGAGGWGRERTSNTAWGYGGRCRVRPVMAEEEGGGRGG